MRQLSAYELNLLHRAGIDPSSLDPEDTTPIEYITSMGEFSGRDFVVTPDVLIPRVETEHLVALVGTYLKTLPEPVWVVDIGTGSGCIGLTLLLEYQDQIETMTLSEVSGQALEVAKRNAQKLVPNNLLSKIQWHLGSLAESVLYPNNTVLVANLPYIPSARTLPEEVVGHEPAVALFGGETGDELIEACLSHHTTRSVKPMAIFLELDYATPESLVVRAGYDTQIINDQFARQRFAKLINQQTPVQG